MVSKMIAHSLRQAERIARRFADRIYTSRETENYYRFRQVAPEKFEEGSYKTEKAARGVYIVWGELKKP